MSFLETIAANYYWQGSLLGLVSCAVLTVLGRKLLLLIPEFKAASEVNGEAAREKMSHNYYSEVQDRATKIGGYTMIFSFGVVVPFCVSSTIPSFFSVLLSAFVLLMFYDLLYYLTHRFIFHGKMLLRLHAVHHQQRNPCVLDSNYLHPMETVIGIGLYLISVVVVTLILGRFHWLELAAISVAYIQINQQNHRLMDLPYFPFNYLNNNSKLHHIHHSGFNSGNYATITPLYDWLFGTYDSGEKSKAA